MLNLLMAPMNIDLTICNIKSGKGMGRGNGKGLGIGAGNGNSFSCKKRCNGQACVENSNQNRHLTNMGFVEGAKISVVSESCGNLIVKVKDSKVAIGRDIAKKIIVVEK